MGCPAQLPADSLRFTASGLDILISHWLRTAEPSWCSSNVQPRPHRKLGIHGSRLPPFHVQRGLRRPALRRGVPAPSAGPDTRGIEIAPFTLAESPSDIAAGAAARVPRHHGARKAWLSPGLHWLMVSPKGLHVTAPDAALARAELGAHPRADRSGGRPGTGRRHGVRIAPAALRHRRADARGSHPPLRGRAGRGCARTPKAAA